MTTGYVELCFDEYPAIVCAGDLDEDTIDLICRTERGAGYGYLEQSEDILSNLYQPLTQAGLSNLNCSNYTSYLNPFDCSYQLTNDSCATSGGPAIITCINGKSA